MEFISKIKHIIIHFLYESPIEPIDVSSLVEELTSLNKVIEKFDDEQTSKKLEYVSALEDNIGGFIKNKKNKKSETHKMKRNKKHKTKKRRLY